MNYILSLLLLLSSHLLFAQVAIQNLYFNSTENILRLNFASPNPTIVYTGKGSGAAIGEGIAHAEDFEGNIIIWINANGVYDKEGNLMPGSSGILSHPSSTEIVIAPFPTDPSKFYIFYNNQLCSQLYYAIVNMSLRGGLGEVTSKNRIVDAGSSFAEGLEIVKIPCSEAYWLLAYQCYSGFKKFLIDEAGISSGTLIAPFDAANHNGRGELDYHKGKLGYAVTYRNKVFLADFDPVTGTVTHPKIINLSATNGIYGLEFSPDGSKAYFTDWNNRDFFGNIASPNLFQYDFSTGAIASWTIPYNTSACPHTTVEGLGQIEQGKDGKLYIPHVNGCQITVVESPNSITPNFKVMDVNTILSTGVSDHIQSQFLPGLEVTASQDTICSGESVILTASGGSGYTWYPAEGLANPNKAITKAMPEKPTTYTVFTENKFGCADSAQITIVVNAVEKPAISISDSASCNSTITLEIASKGGIYGWYKNGQKVAGISGTSMRIDEPGTYRVMPLKKACVVSSEELVIDESYFYKGGMPFVPNVITPDNDPLQANETFKIRNYQGKIRLVIFNRWGKEVFRSKDYQNNWSAEGLATGVYYYRLTHVGNCFPEVIGYVQVMR